MPPTSIPSYQGAGEETKARDLVPSSQELLSVPVLVDGTKSWEIISTNPPQNHIFIKCPLGHFSNILNGGHQEPHDLRTDHFRPSLPAAGLSDDWKLEMGRMREGVGDSMGYLKYQGVLTCLGFLSPLLWKLFGQQINLPEARKPNSHPHYPTQNSQIDSGKELLSLLSELIIRVPPYPKPCSSRAFAFYMADWPSLAQKMISRAQQE